MSAVALKYAPFGADNEQLQLIQAVVHHVLDGAHRHPHDAQPPGLQQRFVRDARVADDRRELLPPTTPTSRPRSTIGTPRNDW
jgi:hypothetical protein